jgi:hypothetical protein
MRHGERLGELTFFDDEEASASGTALCAAADSLSYLYDLEAASRRNLDVVSREGDRALRRFTDVRECVEWHGRTDSWKRSLIRENHAPPCSTGRIHRLREDPGIRILEVRHVLRGGPYGGVFGAFRLTLLLEPTLTVDGGPAAVAGGRYGLAVAGV